MSLFLENKIAVCPLIPELAEKTQKLAKHLNLPLVLDPHSNEAATYAFLLLLTPEHLALHKTANKKLSHAFYIDFLSSKMRYRYQKIGLRRELLARAIGMHPRDNPYIIDATAGLGRDSFILAALGFHITLIEKSPIVYALLQDAMTRAQKEPSIAPIIERMHLHEADAISWLKTTLATLPLPDVIYLDPMFPDRQKSASVKKDMAILQELLGKSEDTEELLEVALTCALRRVVVKRPRLAANIRECAPDFSITGKSSRFDVYLVQKNRK